MFNEKRKDENQCNNCFSERIDGLYNGYSTRIYNIKAKFKYNRVNCRGKVREALREYIATNDQIIELSNKLLKELPKFIMVGQSEKIKQL